MQASNIVHSDLGTQKPLRELNVHTSDRIQLKRCRRLWNWTSPLRGYLQAKTRRAPLWMGTGWHFVMEDYHGWREYESPVHTWRDYVKATFEIYGETYMPDDWRSLAELGEGMARYYELWLQGRDELKTYWLDGEPQVEVNFKIPLPVSQEKLDALGVDVIYYNGTLDRVIETEYGLLAIGEYKTAKAIYKAHYLTDPQITAYCVPLDTEILTKGGWRKYNQLAIGQEVMGYNAETDTMQWTKLEGIAQFNNEPVNRISNKSFEFVATPGHRWVRRVQHKGMSYKEKPKTSLRIDTLDGYKDNSYLVLAASYHSDAACDVTPNEAAIIAWLLTDGTFGDYASGRRASISQSNKKYAEEVHQLLDREKAFTRVTEQNDCKTWHLSMDFFRNLWRKAGLDIDLNGWEKFILSLPEVSRQAFCDAGIHAEGSENGQFYQNKGVKQDIFRLAFFLTGVFPSKGWLAGKGGFENQGICEAFTLSTRHKWMRPVKIEQAGNADVWCPKTTLGTWVMRQGSQIAITGNSWGANCIYPQGVDGCYYYQFKKSVPDEPAILKTTGRLSVDKSKMTTTHRMYRDTLIRMYGDVMLAPKVNVDHLNWLAGTESAENDGFISRDYIVRNEHTLQVEGLKIMMELEDMLNPDLPLYPNPTRECVMFPCDFIEACTNLDDGSDWESVIDQEFESRGEERKNSWRNHLRLHKPYRELILPEPPQLLVRQLAQQQDLQLLS